MLPFSTSSTTRPAVATGVAASEDDPWASTRRTWSHAHGDRMKERGEASTAMDEDRLSPIQEIAPSR
jgi:hypothetical protein